MHDIVRTAGLVVALGLLSSCIRPEAPNAEADILAVTLEGITPTGAPLVTNTEVRISVHAWDDRTALVPHFTLTPGATISPANDAAQDFTAPVTYRVTSESGEWTKEYRVTIAPQEPLPDSFHFDEVERFKQRDTEEERFQEFVLPNGSRWASPNEGFMLSLLFSGADLSDPSLYPVSAVEEGVKGRCAKLATRSTGPFGKMAHKPIAAGTLFLGDFDASLAVGSPLQSTRFGVPEARRPLMLTGYYRYTAGPVLTDAASTEIEGAKDLPDLYAVLFETDAETPHLDGTNVLTSPRIVLRARLAEPKESEEWVYFELPFEPVEGRSYDPAKAYKLTLVASSSRDGADFRGAVGSTLYVDELNIYFE